VVVVPVVAVAQKQHLQLRISESTARRCSSRGTAPAAATCGTAMSAQVSPRARLAIWRAE
jgi:hypothetical protein